MKLIKSISENESFAKMANVRVIFDNGGGITLQFGDWAHWYNGNIEQAAEDYLAYLKDGTMEGWEGHEEDAAALEPTLDEIRNGGYRI